MEKRKLSAFEEIVQELCETAASAPDCEGALVLVKLRSGEYAVSATHDDGQAGCVRMAQRALDEMRQAGVEALVRKQHGREPRHGS